MASIKRIIDALKKPASHTDRIVRRGDTIRVGLPGGAPVEFNAPVLIEVPVVVKVRGPANISFDAQALMTFSAAEVVAIMNGTASAIVEF